MASVHVTPSARLSISARFTRTVFSLAIAAAATACGERNEYAAPPPPKVTVSAPGQQDIPRYYESTGNTASVNSIDLVARVQGFVQAISYTDGQFVKKGTSLFTIEPEPYKLKVVAAKASVTSAQATLVVKQQDFARQEDLLKKQVSAQVTYDQALAARDSAQADVQSAQANEQQAEINLGYTDVTAPFDGVVTARQVSIGQLVGATTPTTLATLVELDPIWVNFNASERDVLEVRAALERQGRTTASLLGGTVEIGLQTEEGYPHVGKLDYIAPDVDPSTGTLAARAILDNPNRTLLPGMFARIRIPGKPRPVLLVPDVAIGSDQGGRYVLVVNKDNIVEQRKVEPSQSVGDLRVIEEGLTKDDRVVIGGIMQAIPGQKVDPVQGTVAAAK
ncbi:MAG TPA: efflux RND transporter periplasmic adaptor subunit [Xanthobacteraceae bacterium]|jgi:RND family efflux transporter MFP subunit|nr:efflux RND transporter periplasmic adaptor subunit [Xanthobacteraceae bacterium]